LYDRAVAVAAVDFAAVTVDAVSVAAVAVAAIAVAAVAIAAVAGAAHVGVFAAVGRLAEACVALEEVLLLLLLLVLVIQRAVLSRVDEQLEMKSGFNWIIEANLSSKCAKIAK